MKITVASKSDKQLVLDIHDCDLALVNSLRRTVLADVPNVALLHDPYAADGSQFEFKENTCVLHNHIMAHRMSMAPLHMSRGEAQSYIPGSVKVRLVAANRGAVAMDVTTEHCEITLHDRPHPDSDRLYPRDSMTGDRPLLTVLKPGEKIDITGTVIQGTAAKHASFAVSSLCTFFPLLDDELIKAGAEAAKESSDPVRALNRFQHIDRKRCWIPNADGNPSAFRFILESECGMTAEDIMKSAVEVLERKVSSAVSRSPQTGADGLVTFELVGEGDTLGNLMQSSAVDALCVEGGPLKFAGYYKPHPLQERVIIRVFLATGDATSAFEAIKTVTLARVLEFKGGLLQALVS